MIGALMTDGEHADGRPDFVEAISTGITPLTKKCWPVTACAAAWWPSAQSSATMVATRDTRLVIGLLDIENSRLWMNNGRTEASDGPEVIAGRPKNT
jgi:hypothetical protein